MNTTTSIQHTLHFGKYKGRKVSSIDNIQYLQWCLKKVKLSYRQRLAVIDRLNYLVEISR